ncbi:MAG: hypothetical protein ACOCWI_02335 [Bacillota bacterium]
MSQRNKKKKIKSIFIMFVLLIIIGGAVFFFFNINSRAEEENDFYLTEDTFVIEGIYGRTYNLSDIEGIRIINSTPELGAKLNGMGFGSIRKGKYRVEGYGECNVYLYTNRKCIHISVIDDDDILINFESESQTLYLYNKLREEIAQL